MVLSKKYVDSTHSSQLPVYSNANSGSKSFNNNDCNTYNKYFENSKIECVTLGSYKDSCHELLCTKCDIKVKVFEKSRWLNDVDYLFFRSFYDDVDMLKSKLAKENFSTAYSCQCFWVNTSKEKEKFDNIRWFCTSHN